MANMLVNSWSTCLEIKMFNFRPFPNLRILQFSMFPKYPTFFADALEAKGQGPTKRQRREPLPAVRRLVSPTEWPWSMHLADLGYGRTGNGKSRVVETNQPDLAKVLKLSLLRVVRWIKHIPPKNMGR